MFTITAPATLSYCAGQPVTEVVVKKDTASEVARLFLQERVKEGALGDISEVCPMTQAANPCFKDPLPHIPTDCPQTVHPSSGVPEAQ